MPNQVLARMIEIVARLNLRAPDGPDLVARVEAAVRGHILDDDEDAPWIDALLAAIIARRPTLAPVASSRQYPDSEGAFVNIVLDLRELAPGFEDEGEYADWPLGPFGLHLHISREGRDDYVLLPSPAPR